MRQRSIAASIPLMLLLSGAAYAQSPTAAPPATAPGAPTTMAPGAPGVAAPQPGSTGAPAAVTGTPTGQPADTMTNNSAAGGNAAQPSRAVPQGGGSGK